jgi:LysR family transcriptional regulator, low CO2-responsive transcriptional regulator
MRNPSLKHIETLQTIASAGSLVQAAATLNMTPAALTARVKALEDAVNLKLFDRTSTGMRLTKAGEAALEASRAVEQAVRDFTDAMLAIRTGEGGRLSVGAVSTAKYFAPRLIAAFIATRPKVDLRFQIGNRDATVDSLRKGEIEIALAGRPPREMAVEAFALGPHPYVLIAPPEHRLAGTRGLTRADLAGEAFLFREIGSGTRSLFDDFIGDTTIKPVQMRMELGSNETIKQAVMAGIGIALISAHTIAAEAADGRLVCLDVDGLPIIRRWYVVNRNDRALSAAARAFRDFAVSQGSTFLPPAVGPSLASSEQYAASVGNDDALPSATCRAVEGVDGPTG